MKSVRRPGYMIIKEAAVRYNVSRAKLHRLVQLGRLQGSTDPRDERVTLLRTGDLEALFRFPAQKGEDMRYDTGTANVAQPSGRLTSELCARMDALRMRAFRGRTLPDESADIIRREREKRTRQIERAISGTQGKTRGRRTG